MGGALRPVDAETGGSPSGDANGNLDRKANFPLPQTMAVSPYGRTPAGAGRRGRDGRKPGPLLSGAKRAPARWRAGYAPPTTNGAPRTQERAKKPRAHDTQVQGQPPLSYPKKPCRAKARPTPAPKPDRETRCVDTPPQPRSAYGQMRRQTPILDTRRRRASR
jgi:hypothetical protein